MTLGEREKPTEGKSQKSLHAPTAQDKCWRPSLMRKNVTEKERQKERWGPSLMRKNVTEKER